MHVVGCQLDIRWHDKPANFAAVRDMLANVELQPDSLVVLPEMFATGFSMEVAEIAELADGPTHRFLAELAAEHRCHVLGGVVGRGPDGLGRNQAALYAPDGRLATLYEKLHPFSFAGETKHYSGGAGVVVCPIGPWRVAPLVCYDLRFPEVFRRAATQGANLLLVIANWPTPRVAHWTQLLIARAIENQAYAVGVNRTGNDPKLAYPGCSMVVDPRGQVLAQLDGAAGLLRADLDLAELEAYRSTFPALADIRPEFLGLG